MLTIKKYVSIPCGSDLTALYRAEVGDYPKFFKMDTACKLGFLLAERLADEPRFTPREDRAVLMFSTCGSLCNDRHYEDTVREFPSPSLFVYTLPNIITGEIAIRNRYQGETEFYVLPDYCPETINRIVAATLATSSHKSVLFGWLDAVSESDFQANLFLADKTE